MNMDTYFQFSLALIFVIALFFVVVLVLRYFGLGGVATTPRRQRQRRVSVVEVTPLDAKRRLVLVRRDEVEHLLLLSPSGDLTVESGIRGGFRDAVATVQGTPTAVQAKGDTP